MTDPLHDILVATKAYERPLGDHFRIELVTAVRKFAVVVGYIELERLCDEHVKMEKSMGDA